MKKKKQLTNANIKMTETFELSDKILKEDMSGKHLDKNSLNK